MTTAVVNAGIVRAADVRSAREPWRNICLPGFLTFSPFLLFLSPPAAQGMKLVVSEKILLRFIV